MPGHLPGFPQQGPGLFRFGAHLGFQGFAFSVGWIWRLPPGRGLKAANSPGPGGARARGTGPLRGPGWGLGRLHAPRAAAPENSKRRQRPLGWGWGTRCRAGSPGSPARGAGGREGRPVMPGHSGFPAADSRPASERSLRSRAGTGWDKPFWKILAYWESLMVGARRKGAERPGAKVGVGRSGAAALGSWGSPSRPHLFLVCTV